MKKNLELFAAVALLAAAPISVLAGGVDRSVQSSMLLFEGKNYAEFTIGYLDPSVSGTAAPAMGGGYSGNMLKTYSPLNGGINWYLNEQVNMAFIIDKPFGSSVAYPTGTGYFAQGATAELESMSYTVLARYKLPSGVSFFGGPRFQQFSAKATIPFVTGIPGKTAPYTVDGRQDSAWGYAVGVGWEKPDIAAKVALTYNSEIDYNITTLENTFRGAKESSTPVSTPQSVNLDFQTGVAPDTLLFGSVRWVDWTRFNIAPVAYFQLTQAPLVSYPNSTTAYTIGVGYKFNQNWSGAISYTHDTSMGGFQSNLQPFNGYNAIALAATYTVDKFKIMLGARYMSLGDADTSVGKVAPAANFSGNHAIGYVARIGYYF